VIRELLAASGFPLPVDEVFVSCDHRLNKRSGRLFALVQKHFEVASERHHHVGDNPHSDVAAAQKLGIATTHYRNAREDGPTAVAAARFTARGDAAGLRRLFAVEVAPPADFSPRQRELFSIGAERALAFKLCLKASGLGFELRIRTVLGLGAAGSRGEGRFELGNARRRPLGRSTLLHLPAQARFDRCASSLKISYPVLKFAHFSLAACESFRERHTVHLSGRLSLLEGGVDLLPQEEPRCNNANDQSSTCGKNQLHDDCSLLRRRAQPR